MRVWQIELIGPRALTVDAGFEYARCAAGAPAAAVCDRGAKATDTADGDLTQRVLACANADVSYKFSSAGLAGYVPNLLVYYFHACLIPLANA